jgi:hypothetical protein
MVLMMMVRPASRVRETMERLEEEMTSLDTSHINTIEGEIYLSFY